VSLLLSLIALSPALPLALPLPLPLLLALGARLCRQAGGCAAQPVCSSLG
jgi:hypothetical protein